MRLSSCRWVGLCGSCVSSHCYRSSTDTPEGRCGGSRCTSLRRPTCPIGRVVGRSRCRARGAACHDHDVRGWRAVGVHDRHDHRLRRSPLDHRARPVHRGRFILALGPICPALPLQCETWMAQRSVWSSVFSASWWPLSHSGSPGGPSCWATRLSSGHRC